VFTISPRLSMTLAVWRARRFRNKHTNLPGNKAK
jgi:hypothetical protein